MADVVDKATRSRMMSGIRSKNTKPEITIRKALHSRGYRYRLHSVDLPGKPDIIFVSRKAVVFVHGCFWHGHGCHLFKWPMTRQEFWKAKILRNREKDEEVAAALSAIGWRILIVWECVLKGRGRKSVQEITDDVSRWLDEGSANSEIRGCANGRHGSAELD